MVRLSITTRARSKRSASAPPRGESAQGARAAKVTAPTQKPLPESSRASQARAMIIAQRETAEATEANQSAR